MPRRTTPFQRMLFHVQQQLTPDAEVEESALLRELVSGKQREVDVVIRSGIGEHQVVVSLECLERKRKATVEWVEQMAMKHQVLPTHKLVLVSFSGFSDAAAEKARSLGIDAYTFDAALDVDWTAMVGEQEFPLTWLHFHLFAVTLIFAGDARRTEYAAGPSTPLWSADGVERGSLGAYVDPLLESWDSFGEPAAEFIGERERGPFGVEIRPKTRFYVADPQGKLHEVEALRAYIEFEVETTPIGLTSGAWRGTPVGFGAGDSPLGEVSITVLETGEGAAIGAMTVSDPATGEPTTVKFETPREPSAFRLIAQGGPLGFRDDKPAKPSRPHESDDPE